MKEIKEEVIHKSYVTKYKALDGTVFDDSEECKKYEASAKGMLLAKYRELEIKMISEYNLFGVGSEEYYLSIVKLKDELDIDLMTQLYCLFNPRYENDESRIKEARDVFRKAVETEDFLIINRGCDYDQHDSFWIFGLLTATLNSVVKACDPGAIIEIKDDLTYPDKQ
jgi:hypothetical protein